mgnify:CR=1 FL=1
MPEIEVSGDVVKARHFGEVDGEYAKLVVHRDLLADDEKATVILDEMRDAIAQEGR